MTSLPKPCDSTQPCDLTWADLVALEPRLLVLEEDCRRYSGRRPLDFWYGQVKPAVCQLVGFYGQAPLADERLATSQAYDAAYDRLFTVLMRKRRSGVERRGWAA